MKYLVWKQGSPYNNWVVSYAEQPYDLYHGYADKLPNWFTTRRQALNFIRENYGHAETYIYRGRLKNMIRFYWFSNLTYLGV